MLEMPRADLGEITLLLDKYITNKEVAWLMTASTVDVDSYGLIKVSSRTTATAMVSTRTTGRMNRTN